VNSRLPQLDADQRRALRARLGAASPERRWTDADPQVAPPTRLSVYFFPSAGSMSVPDYYATVLEAASRADAAGLHAVWLPERHFVLFGGQHPNPAVLGAAIAARTSRIRIRAGSVAAPLHHVVRIAEEWSVVDNLSSGRAGISFASGWHPDDFVLSRGSHADRRAATLHAASEVRALWGGAERSFPTADGEERTVRLTPVPVQPVLPMWLTAAGSPKTFEDAATLGCGVMTALLGQTLAELRRNIARYRAAWRDAGHPGAGDVVVMVHAHVSDEPDLETRLRPAMISYLAAFRRQTSDAAADEALLLEAGYQAYFNGPSLLGSRAKARAVLAELANAGADEVGCLVDFGLPGAAILDGVNALADLARTESDR